jgi:hypothetical protein
MCPIHRHSINEISKMRIIHKYIGIARRTEKTREDNELEEERVRNEVALVQNGR